MVAEPRAWIDIESAVREWARDNVEAVTRRVFFAFSGSSPLPQIVLFRIAGTDDRCLIQFDVWAKDKARAAQVAASLATAADGLGRFVHGQALLHGATVQDVRWQPDPESDSARYVVDVLFTATSI